MIVDNSVNAGGLDVTVAAAFTAVALVCVVASAIAFVVIVDACAAASVVVAIVVVTLFSGGWGCLLLQITWVYLS